MVLVKVIVGGIHVVCNTMYIHINLIYKQIFLGASAGLNGDTAFPGML